LWIMAEFKTCSKFFYTDYFGIKFYTPQYFHAKSLIL
jgi:hypothetical protein